MSAIKEYHHDEIEKGMRQYPLIKAAENIKSAYDEIQKICKECGKEIDFSNLTSVMIHEHNDSINPAHSLGVKGRRVILSAKEIYPNCSNKFACGVHQYLNGEGKPMRPEEDDVIRGYWQADQDNLKDKFILNLKP